MPLLWLSAAFIAGILLGKLFNLPWLVWVIAGCVFLFLSILDRLLCMRFTALQRFRLSLPVAPALILLFFCLGGLRYTLSLPRMDATRLSWYIDRDEYTLVGTISAPPDVRKDYVRYEITLPAGEPVEIEPGLTLTVIGEATEQAAYALQYGEVIILIPAGVDYALLKEKYPDLMQKPDLLILNPDDVSYIPPHLWSGLEPKTILWNNLDPSPYQGAFSLNSVDRISFISDGIQVWLDTD